MKSFQTTPLYTAIVLALAATGAMAEQPSGSSGSQATLPEVRVTADADKQSSVAGFGDQPVLDTPFSVKVLPKELLANQGVEDIGELDRLDASVTSSAQSPGDYSQVLIRGVGLHNWSNYRYNGLMMVNQQSTGLENKERVEILKGLSALQAGFADPGGLVNYVTKRPGAESINDVHVAANEHGNAKVHTDISRGAADGSFGVRVNAAWEELRSYVEGADGDRGFLSLAADWRITSNTIFKLDIEHEKREQIAQPYLLAHPDGSLPSNVNPKTFLGQTWAAYPTTFTLVGSKLEHFLSNQWSLVAEANWMRLKRDQKSILLDSIQPNGEADVYLYYSPDQTREPVNGRVMANGKFSTGGVGHDLTFGYSIHRHEPRWPNGFYDLIGTTNIYNPRTIADPNAVSDPSYVTMRVYERGAFVNDVLSLSEAWKLHLGGRYAMRDEKSYDNTGTTTRRYDKNVFSPSVALVFKPQSNISTYVSYIEGLEQGGTAPLGTTNQNEQMDPRTSKQLEAGVKADLGGVTAETAVFQIDRPAEYVNSANTYVQGGQHVFRGLEISLAGRVAREWTLFGSAMLLDAELKETGDTATQGKRPSNVPEQRLALVAEYSPQTLAGWTFSGNWTHTGSRWLNDQNTGEEAPGYNLFGLGARYNTKFGNTPTTLRVNVDNLSDKRYWSNAGFGSLTAGAPRTISASMSMRF